MELDLLLFKKKHRSWW